MSKKKLNVITLGDKKFNGDKLTELGSTLITDLKTLEGLLQQQSLAVSATTIAKNTLLEKLLAESVNFEEIE